MIRFLAKRLIADYDNPSSPKVRQAYGILCGAVGICFNLLLFAGKFFAGLLQHPFGHGRIEYVSGLVVAGAILIMAFELIKTSLEKIIHPEAVDFQPVSLIILAVSIGVKLYMSSYNRSTGEKIDSAAMKATALDSLSDALSTSVVLVASIIGHFTSLNIDGWCGIAVGLFIFYAGFQAAKDTLNPLLGQAPNPEFIQNIRDITLAHPEILGIHDMLVHDYGPGRQMVSLHCEVSSSGDILLLHDTIDNIERELRSKLHCDAVIHMDPIQDQDEETVKIHHEVLELIHKINPLISIHDFRMVKGNTHTNLIFDVMIPVDYPTPPKVLTKQIELMVQEQHPDFYTVITVDRDYAR